MGRYHIGMKDFRCTNDHAADGVPLPCPGHMLDVWGHASTDTITLTLDGEMYITMDAGVWDALVEVVQIQYGKRGDES